MDNNTKPYIIDGKFDKRAYDKWYYQKNKNKWYKYDRKEYNKEWYEKNKEYYQKRYIENKESISERQKKYKKENKDKINKLSQKWRDNNREKFRESCKKYKLKNKANITKHNIKRLKGLKYATPSWADMNYMNDVYSNCREANELFASLGLNSWKMQVDHIHPLKSDFVCGLHNEFNLQVISAKENLQKRNKFYPDYI